MPIRQRTDEAPQHRIGFRWFLTAIRIATYRHGEALLTKIRDRKLESEALRLLSALDDCDQIYGDR